MRIRLTPIACQSIVLAVCLGMPMPLIASLANRANAASLAETTGSNPATSTDGDTTPITALRAVGFDTRIMTTGSIVGW
ncbi:hypothetical protein [Pinirhizobacter sp.]|jgi:hypothetical protein|uniref:hypothetical protein n=1 Tax=Pinirhizobacter sp. TaxID=2950432 RepID=UPI002F418958